MLFSEINPYVRYARYLNLDKNSLFDEWVALDARLFYIINGFINTFFINFIFIKVINGLICLSHSSNGRCFGAVKLFLLD